jgi:hypothetical protein
MILFDLIVNKHKNNNEKNKKTLTFNSEIFVLGA